MIGTLDWYKNNGIELGREQAEFVGNTIHFHERFVLTRFDAKKMRAKGYRFSKIGTSDFIYISKGEC